MRISRFRRSARLARSLRQSAGFSILEILVAITILVIGLTGMAALVAQTLSGTDRARYLSLATSLASEKLEDLNRWPAADPHVSAGGSLSADTSSGSVNYYDDIDLSNASGQVSESIASTTGGNTTYYNVVHNSTGYVDSAPTSSAPSTSGVITFHRRWLIESNPQVNGVTVTGIRRVTVVVTLTNQIVQPPVSFQLSQIRP